VSKAIIPAIRNDIQTADPANAAASPSKAKIPAPTIEPTPNAIALRTVIVRRLLNVHAHSDARINPASDNVAGRVESAKFVSLFSLLGPTDLPASAMAG
jgi:hypothetical protein